MRASQAHGRRTPCPTFVGSKVREIVPTIRAKGLAAPASRPRAAAASLAVADVTLGPVLVKLCALTDVPVDYSSNMLPHLRYLSSLQLPKYKFIPLT